MMASSKDEDMKKLVDDLIKDLTDRVSMIDPSKMRVVRMQARKRLLEQEEREC